MILKKDLFEIRIESFGGLGASLFGKILGELGALYLGLNASCFSSYGCEKNIAPVKAYVRYAKETVPIRDTNPVKIPDLLVIFHLELAKNKDVLKGVGENTKIVINTDKDIENIRDELELYAGDIYCIDALKISLETKSDINIAMLGAVSKAVDFIKLEKIEELLKDSHKYDENLKNHINAINLAYENTKYKEIKPDGKYHYIVDKPINTSLGYKNASIGGINKIIGSSISNDLSPTRRGYVPVILKDKCTHCGYCDLFCPDMAFKFVDGKNLGIDYHYCKGCMRCVSICKEKAIIKMSEKDKPENVNIIDKNIKYDKVGENSLVTSESFLEDINI